LPLRLPGARTLLALSSLVSLLSSSSADASAYYAGEIGARSVARGGANLVNPGDPSAVWLNPAAITLAHGVQLQLDLNLVWLQSQFIRDCGGVDNGCAPLADVNRTYNDPATGRPDPRRTFSIAKGSRKLGEVFSPGDGSQIPVDNAVPGRLGDIVTPNDPSRFDGETNVVRNEAGVQPIPRLLATFNGDTFGLDGFALGVFAFAPSSGDYRFSEGGPSRYTLIDRDILEIFYGLTLGYRYENWFAIGASLQGVTAGLNQNIRLSGDGAGNEDPNYDVQVRINGTQHFIPSGNIGVWTSPLEPLGIHLEIGGSVQLPRYVRTTGPLTVESIGAGLQKNFFDSGLATLNTEGATATAEFALPPFWRLGAKYVNEDLLKDGKKTVGLEFEVDGVLEQWSAYDNVFLTINDLSFAVAGQAAAELPPVVQPKDWVDAWSVRAGTTVSFLDEMFAVHGGGYYESSAVPNATHTVEVVDGDKIGLGAGVSAKLWGTRLDVGYGHIIYFDRTIGQESIVTSGNVVLPPPVGAQSEPRTRVAMGRYSASLDELNVAVTIAFDEMFGFGVYAPKAVAALAEPLPAPTPSSTESAPSPEAAPAPSTTPTTAPATDG
jgi:long-chain fatty acid transport protein